MSTSRSGKETKQKKNRGEKLLRKQCKTIPQNRRHWFPDWKGSLRALDNNDEKLTLRCRSETSLRRRVKEKILKAPGIRNRLRRREWESKVH